MNMRIREIANAMFMRLNPTMPINAVNKKYRAGAEAMLQYLLDKYHPEDREGVDDMVMEWLRKGDSKTLCLLIQGALSAVYEGAGEWERRFYAANDACTQMELDVDKLKTQLKVKDMEFRAAEAELVNVRETLKLTTEGCIKLADEINSLRKDIGCVSLHSIIRAALEHDITIRIDTAIQNGKTYPRVSYRRVHDQSTHEFSFIIPDWTNLDAPDYHVLNQLKDNLDYFKRS